MGLELWIPKSAVEKRRKCLICGKTFPDEQRQQWQRHVLACDKKNPERIEEAEHRRKSSAFTSIWDEEQYAFLRKRAANRKDN